jgi:hypothetical protein
MVREQYKPTHFYPKQEKKNCTKRYSKRGKKKCEQMKVEKWRKVVTRHVVLGHVTSAVVKKWIIMSVWEGRDDRTADKHTDRPFAHCHFPQTRPRVAPRSPSRRRCATKLRHHRRSACHHPGSGGARRVYSARHRRTHRDGRARRRVYSVLAVERRVP